MKKLMIGIAASVSPIVLLEHLPQRAAAGELAHRVESVLAPTVRESWVYVYHSAVRRTVSNDNVAISSSAKRAVAVWCGAGQSGQPLTQAKAHAGVGGDTERPEREAPTVREVHGVRRRRRYDSGGYAFACCPHA